MKTSHVVILTAVAVIIAAGGPLIAQEGRPLRTMPHGIYQCALPGDAEGLAFEVVEEEGFTIEPASRYSNPVGGGTYLMRGRELVFTDGPKKGEEFRLIGPNRLQRRNADDTLGRLICTRLGGTG